MVIYDGPITYLGIPLIDNWIGLAFYIVGFDDRYNPYIVKWGDRNA